MPTSFVVVAFPGDKILNWTEVTRINLCSFLAWFTLFMLFTMYILRILPFYVFLCIVYFIVDMINPAVFVSVMAIDKTIAPVASSC